MEIGSKSMKLWIVLASMVVTQAYAGQVTVPNTFVSGTKAKASEVNANFSAVQQGINDNDARISQNTSDIYTNTTAIGTINSQVSSNQASIQTNASAILGNAANIATNASNITANASSINANSNAIMTLQQAIPATYQVVDSYGTVLGDLLGTGSNSTTFISSQGYLSQAGGYPYYELLPLDIIDGYTSVDCTGPKITLVGSYTFVRGSSVIDAAGQVFDVPLLYDAYGNITSQNRSYVPFNAPKITVVVNSYLGRRDFLYDPYTGAPVVDPYTGSLIPYPFCQPTGPAIPPRTIVGYQYLPNDPAVTGIPNTIGFPLRIQKK